MGWNARIWLFGAGLVAGWGGVAIAAQDAGIPTLHVYESLMQIPVLVLDPLGLHRLPGRRVMLAITDGNDKGGKYSLERCEDLRYGYGSGGLLDGLHFPALVSIGPQATGTPSGRCAN